MSVFDKDPTVRQAKWIYWLALFIGALIGVAMVHVYGVPIILVFLVMVLSAVAGVTKGYYDDV